MQLNKQPAIHFNKKSVPIFLLSYLFALAPSTNSYASNSDGRSVDSGTFRIYENINLGAGIDIESNGIKNAGKVDFNKFIAQDGSEDGDNEVKYTGLMYKDSAIYAGDLSASSRLTQMSFQGGLSGSYGLYSGGLKAGFERNDSSASGQSAISKNAGIIFQREAYLPIVNPITDISQNGSVTEDKFDLSPRAIDLTTQALFNARPSLKAAILAIRMAKTPEERRQKLIEFRVNYGTHAVVGVTMAAIANRQYKFTQKASGSGSDWRTNAEASFNSPYVSGSAKSSYQETTELKSKNWAFSRNSIIYPYTKDLSDSLDALVIDADSQFNKAQGDAESIMDLGKISFPGTSKGLPDNVPNLTNMPTPSLTPEGAQKLKAEQQKLRDAKVDLAQLNAWNNEIDGNRRNGADGLQKVKDRVNSPEFNNKLNAFLPDETKVGRDYTDVYLSNNDLDVVLRARMFRDTYKDAAAPTALRRMVAQAFSSFTSSVSPEEDFNALKQIRDENVQSNNKLFPTDPANSDYHKEKLNFISYLTDTYNRGSKTQSFATWYSALSPTDLLALQKAWLGSLSESSGIRSGTRSAAPLTFAQSASDAAPVSNESLAIYQELHDQNDQLKTEFLNAPEKPRARFGTAALFSSDTPVNPVENLVVVNFSVVPWAVLFKDFNVSLVPNASQLILAKIIQQIDSFITDENYLHLASTIDTKSSTLSTLYNTDKQSLLSSGSYASSNSLVELRKNAIAVLDNTNPVISYSGTSYDINDANKLTNLVSAISAAIQQSAMRTSNWYKIVADLKTKGLLNPNGAFLTFNRANWDAAKPGSEPTRSNAQATLIVEGADNAYISGATDLDHRLLSNAVSLPRQLAKFIQKGSSGGANIIETVLPVVTGTTVVGVHGEYNDLNYISSKGFKTKEKVSTANAALLLDKENAIRGKPFPNLHQVINGNNGLYTYKGSRGETRIAPTLYPSDSRLYYTVGLNWPVPNTYDLAWQYCGIALHEKDGYFGMNGYSFLGNDIQWDCKAQFDGGPSWARAQLMISPISKDDLGIFTNEMDGFRSTVNPVFRQFYTDAASVDNTIVLNVLQP